MPNRGPLALPLLGIGLLAGGALAVVGGLALPPDGLVAVSLAAVVSGCLAAGIARESDRPDRRATMDAAWRAAAAAVAVLLVLSGAAVLGGALLTLLLAGAGATAALAVWVVRTDRGIAAGVPQVPPATVRRPVPVLPVSALSTGDLGREWVRTTEALATRLDLGTRQALVVRRQETLDELERRDPAGFARWLAATPSPGSDPAGHLRHGDPAA
ncbi:hypothetical protein GCU56_07025 [Geodermatophilus sabuli]|uniref:Uncharacterized protein n=1 Tax=Geodermatophilus sabuli TaxID=1564158 RepID=A0A7K3VYF6_9ACTN|nr:hypothetical protein [Geodermatophilus sabuli]NEK57622.1 hypothetical protein [Geodermatophilus sabuli]